MVMDTHALWAEKYSPQSLNDYIFQSPKQREICFKAVKDKALPGHLFFSGTPGTGKTTLAKLLIKEIGVDDNDVLMI